MKLRYKLLAIAVFLGIIFMWGRYSGRAARPSSIPVVLPGNDVEQIRVNPSTHQGIIVTPRGTQTFTLPDRVSTIDVRKDGSVKVTSPQMGFETHPFVGVGYGQGTRLYLGADLGYYKKVDAGLGIATPDLLDRSSQKFNDFRFGAFGSYTVYSNTRATLGIDTQKAVHFVLSVRL